jgi:hypothetical protein
VLQEHTQAHNRKVH